MYNLSTSKKRVSQLQENQGTGQQKHFCAMRTVTHWKRLPREVVDALCLSVSRRHLENALSSMLYLLGSSEGLKQLGLVIFEGPFQQNYIILF